MVAETSYSAWAFLCHGQRSGSVAHPSGEGARNSCSRCGI